MVLDRKLLFLSGGSPPPPPNLIQTAGGGTGTGGAATTFASVPLVGSLIIFECFSRDGGPFAPAAGGVPDASFTLITSGNELGGWYSIYAKVRNSTQQQFPSMAGFASKQDKTVLYEVAGITLAGAVVNRQVDTAGASGDPGAFAGSSAGDFILEAIVEDSSPAPAFTIAGFTQDYVGTMAAGEPAYCAAHRFGGGVVPTAYSFSAFAHNAAAAVRFLAASGF